MKAEISAKYLILIAVAVLSAAVVIMVADQLITEAALNAFETAFD